jgi:DNA polymerase-1
LENADVEKDKKIENLFEYITDVSVEDVFEKIKKQKELYYYFETANDEEALIIKKKITKINIYMKDEKKVYNIKFDANNFKEIFEDKNILKCGYQQKDDYILLKQENINPKNMMFDVRIAMYLLNSGTNLYSLEEVAKQHLNIDLEDYYNTKKEKEDVQTSFFDDEIQEEDNEINYKYASYSYVIGESKTILEEKLQEVEELELFKNIEMPTSEVLAEMKYTGVLVDKNDIEKMSIKLKKQISKISDEIYELAGEEFNINSPKQLGEILFEKLGLPYKKKNKNGYSTDVDTLEKLKNNHPIIEKVLDYRQVSKLNSTFVEGMIPYINDKTNRIHTTFHQTVASTR